MTLFEDQFELSSASIAEVRHWVRDRCVACIAGHQADLDKIEIALGEVLQNIVRYAYEGLGLIDVRVCDLGKCVGVTIHDYAPPKPVDQWSLKPAGSEGGFGLNFIAQCSDAHRFRATDEGNRCSLYFFVDHNELSSESLLWAGEILEARVVNESMKDWCRWSLSNVLSEGDFSILEIAVDAVESFERQNARIPEFHNLQHFRDVLITVCHLVERLDEPLSRDETLAMVFAAILHDYGHPGRQALYPGEIEDHTVDLVRNLLSPYQSESNSKVYEMCIDLIMSTSPRRKGRWNTLQTLFNLCDVGPSFIPDHGFAQAQLIALELEDNFGPQLWSSFKDQWRVYDAAEPLFLRSWRNML